MIRQKLDTSLVHVKLGIDAEDMKLIRQLAKEYNMTPDGFMLGAIRFAIENLERDKTKRKVKSW